MRRNWDESWNFETTTRIPNLFSAISIPRRGSRLLLTSHFWPRWIFFYTCLHGDDKVWVWFEAFCHDEVEFVFEVQKLLDHRLVLLRVHHDHTTTLFHIITHFAWNHSGEHNIRKVAKGGPGPLQFLPAAAGQEVELVVVWLKTFGYSKAILLSNCL